MTAFLSHKVSLITGVSAFIASMYMLAPAPAEAARLQRCAQENGICQLPYPTEVIYGYKGQGTSRFIDRREVRCSNRVFGDPAPGKDKTCSFVVRERFDDRRDDRRDDWRDDRRNDWRDDRRDDRRSDWQRCAKENGFCDFYGRKTVRYGAKGRFTERVFRDGVQCDNRSFGDPARGQDKACYIQN